MRIQLKTHVSRDLRGIIYGTRISISYRPPNQVQFITLHVLGLVTGWKICHQSPRPPPPTPPKTAKTVDSPTTRDDRLSPNDATPTNAAVFHPSTSRIDPRKYRKSHFRGSSRAIGAPRISPRARNAVPFKTCRPQNSSPIIV